MNYFTDWLTCQENKSFLDSDVGWNEKEALPMKNDYFIIMSIC